MQTKYKVLDGAPHQLCMGKAVTDHIARTSCLKCHSEFKAWRSASLTRAFSRGRVRRRQLGLVQLGRPCLQLGLMQLGLMQLGLMQLGGLMPRGKKGRDLPGALCGFRPQAVAESLKRFRVPDLCVVAVECLPQPMQSPFGVVEVVTPSRGEIAPFLGPFDVILCPRL